MDNNVGTNINTHAQSGLYPLGPQTSSSRANEDVNYWATFQFDYSNTGYTGVDAPETNNTLWKFKAKGQIFSSPVVVNDKVYFTTDQGLLYAVNRKNGEQAWSFDLKQNSYATATFSRGYIYVGTGTEGQNAENYLYRINANTGIEDTNSRITIFEGSIAGAPLVFDLPGEAEDRIYFGTLKDNKIYSYNFGSSGSIPIWEYGIPNGGMGGSDGIWSSPIYYASDPAKLLFTVNSESISPSISRGLFCMKPNDG
ncbi:unnamed protein product, partial [marine sediment metagenome]